MNSKNKGNTFERKIAKELSIYLTDGKEKYAIWRTASSGAVSTILHKKLQKENMVISDIGDLKQNTPINKYSKLDKFFDMFFIETKFYKDLYVSFPLTSKLWNILVKLNEQKEICKKEFFFVLKNNRKSELLLSSLHFKVDIGCLGILLVNKKLVYIYSYQDFITNKVMDYLCIEK